jgi:hypothetical protein
MTYLPSTRICGTTREYRGMRTFSRLVHCCGTRIALVDGRCDIICVCVAHVWRIKHDVTPSAHNYRYLSVFVTIRYVSSPRTPLLHGAGYRFLALPLPLPHLTCVASWWRLYLLRYLLTAFTRCCPADGCVCRCLCFARTDHFMRLLRCWPRQTS